MHIRFLSLLGAATFGGAVAGWPALDDGGSPLAAPFAASGAMVALDDLRSVPPAPWNAADPADSLYRVAREAFNRGDYGRAAELFHLLNERYPDSEYRPSALYFGAYSHYRMGGSNNLHRALDLLAAYATVVTDATARGDADALRARVNGALAQLGDAGAAEDVVRTAAAAAGGARGDGDGGASSGGQPASCPREGDDERVAALNALLQMDAERAMPILQCVLARRDACSATLRRRAVFLVAQKDGAAREDALLNIVRSDPDPEVRSQAVFWLSSIDSPRSVEILEELLRSSTDERVQERALYALSAQKAPRARQVLRDYATRAGAPRELRERAIFWLGQSNGSEHAEFLRQLYATLDDQELKERVLFSLSQTKGVGNERWLMQIAQNRNEPAELRGRAIFWLGQGGMLGTEELAGLYDRLGEREVKEQTIFALSQRSDRAAVDKLMSIARGEQDRGLRERALFWLSQSKDPRVAAFLLEIIDR